MVAKKKEIGWGNFFFSWAPLWLFLLSLIVRFVFITERDIALDEPFSIFHSQKSFVGIIKMLKNENNPPLHFFLLHIWIKLFGTSPLAVRSMSLLISAFIPPVIYAIGKRCWNKQIGLLAALLAVFATQHIYFSHEARVYSLLALLSGLSVMFFLQSIKQAENNKVFWALIITNILLLYAHYLAVFLVFSQMLAVVLVEPLRNYWRKYFISFLLSSLAFLPMAYLLVYRVGQTLQNGTWVSAPHWTHFYGFLNLMINNSTVSLVLILIIIVLIAINFKEIVRKRLSFFADTNNKVIFILFLMSYLGMFLFSYKNPIFIERYVFFLSPLLILLIAISVDTFSVKPAQFNIVGFILVVTMVFTMDINPDNNRRLADAVNYVKEQQQDSTLVLIAPSYADLAFAYHYNRAMFSDTELLTNKLQKNGVITVGENKTLSDELNNDSINRYIYFQADTEFSDPDNLIYKQLQHSLRIESQKRFFQIYTITTFVKK